MAEIDAADLLRQPVRQQAVEPVFGAGARDLELRKAGDVDQADALAHGAALVADMLEIVRAPEAPDILRLDPVGREPVRPFPAVALSEDGARRRQFVVARAGLGRARGRTFLVGIVDDEDVLVGLLVLGLGVVLVGVGPEAAGIDVHHVDPGLALDDPFGELPAGTAGRRDAEAMPFIDPEVPQAVGRTDHGAAVGRIGDRPVDHVLNADLAEDRHAVDRRVDMRLQPLDVAGEQVLAEAVRHAVDEAGRRAFLIGAEDQALPFLAHVVGRVAFPQHRHLGQALLVALDQRRMRLGDDVLVLDGDDRNVEADHGRGLARIVAGRRDHVLASDVALLGAHQPFAARRALDRRHRRLAIDLAAAVAGANGQRLGQVGRGDMAVIRMIERAHQAVGVAERPELLHLGRRDDLERHADGVRGAAILVILVHPVAICGEPQVTGDVEAHVLAGLGLERLVQIDGVFVDLADAVAHVEQRQQAGGMPGRSGRQLGPLAQHDVGPALLGQVIERADADNAATDHDNPRMRFHGFVSCRLAATPRLTAI